MDIEVGMLLKPKIALRVTAGMSNERFGDEKS